MYLSLCRNSTMFQSSVLHRMSRTECLLTPPYQLLALLQCMFTYDMYIYPYNLTNSRSTISNMKCADVGAWCKKATTDYPESIAMSMKITRRSGLTERCSQG